MKRIYILVIAICIGSIVKCYSQAPSWQWACVAEGSNPLEISTSITTDANGNVYTVGYFMGPSITFGNHTIFGSSFTTSFIVKQNSVGNVIWAKSIFNSAGSYVYSSKICIDTAGFIYIVGDFNGTISFNSINLTTNSAAGDFFLIKLDNAGNGIWGIHSNATIYANANDVCVDRHGDLYVTVNYKGNISFGNNNFTCTNATDLILVKFNSSASPIWAKYFKGDYLTTVSSIATDSEGNVNICGYYAGKTMTFDSVVINNTTSDSSNRDIFIARYNADGSFAWARSAGRYENDWGYDICTDNKGNIYVTGEFNGSSIIFDNYVLHGNGCRNTFVLKLNSNNTIIWAKGFGGQSGNNTGSAIICDASDNFYLGGSFFYAFQNDSCSLYSADNLDVYIAKFDASGSPIWAKNGGNALYIDVAYISIDLSGNCFVTGSFVGATATFGSIILNHDTVITNHDIYIANLGLPTGINELHNEKLALNIYPNPATSKLTINLQQQTILQNTTVSIYDVQGKLLLQQSITQPQTELNIASFAKGIYVVKVNNDKQSMVNKFVKE
ncbi:MAG: T9SS type A sorting domain-containing protein [Bacteroidetes bacterium]|nr:T9SS type A sorting domain-containing protein [Bacteroidota bacterium]